MTSPLLFAQNFIQFKSQLIALPSDDLKLIHLNEFWIDIKQILESDAYSSYVDEYCQFLKNFITETSLCDLKLKELKQLHEITIALSLKSCNSKIINRLITVYCYVGEFEQALKAYSEFTSIQGGFPEIVNLSSVSSKDGLKIICNQLHEINQDVYQYFKVIDDKWVGLSDSLSHNSTHCLFVLRDNFSNNHRGRLCLLESSVELFSKTIKNDEVTFENQIRTPDDPFVGVLYNSLSSVREILRLQSYKEIHSRYYHSHFSIANSQTAFTGDSIGLAASVVTYTQLLKTELLRHERFISGDVAFTGSVDKNGNILKINDTTISEKIERAFFSHLKYVVLPIENHKTAKQTIDKLNQKFPNRHLHLISMNSLSDLLEDKNIIRSEKICIGEYTAKTVYKYGKMTKLQVPLLLLLIYSFVCVLFPKAQFWFDRSPQYLQITENGFEALNADSLSLWKVEMECPIEYIHTYSMEDIDNDGLNEVAYAPQQMRSKQCQQGGNLFLYDDNGDVLWSIDAVLYDCFPVKNNRKHEYSLNNIKIIKVNNSFQILTTVSSSHPSTIQIRLWSITGNPLSWYINSGSTSFTENRFYQLKEKFLVFCGINNFINSAVLYVLDAHFFEGISPSYEVFESLNTTYQKGNQIHYVRFPQTDVSLVMKELYNGVQSVLVESDNQFWINVYELTNMGEKVPVISYLLDNSFRVKDIRIFDQFRITRNLLVDQGMLPKIDWDEYKQERILAVEYWIDSCFITERELRSLENNSK